MIDGAIGTFGHIYITAPKDQRFLTETEAELAQYFAAVPEIEFYSTHVVTAGAGEFEGSTSSSLLIGVGPNEMDATTIDDNIKSGSFLSFMRDDEVVIGLGLADALKGYPYDDDTVTAGDTVTVTGEDGIRRPFFVQGIIDTKNFYSNYNFYTTQTAAQTMIGSGEKISEVIVRLYDISEIATVMDKLKNQGIQAHIATWREPAGYIESIVSGIGIFLQIIAFVSILVGAVITGAILFVHTERKRRHIGILKALGTSTRFIVALFLTESMILSVIGILFGGLLYSGLYQYFKLNPVEILIGDLKPLFDIRLVVIATAVFLGATFAAGIIPARNAAGARVKKILAER